MTGWIFYRSGFVVLAKDIGQARKLLRMGCQYVCLTHEWPFGKEQLRICLWRIDE